MFGTCSLSDRNILKRYTPSFHIFLKAVFHIPSSRPVPFSQCSENIITQTEGQPCRKVQLYSYKAEYQNNLPATLLIDEPL
jgi:hypothetical protein